MALLDRLQGEEEPKIPAHQFYASLVAVADGQLTRTQLENLWTLSSTGQDATELDVIFNGYTAAADKSRYLTAVHAIFMLVEDENFPVLTGSQITTWLSAAEAAY